MSTSHRRHQLLDQFLTGQIDRETYDRLLADLQDPGSSSVVSASLIVERSSEPAEVVIASTNDSKAGSLSQPIALVGPGVELGGFRIEKSLGRGGMGEVWRARDLVGDRTVVIKLLHPEFVHHPEELASVKDTFLRVHRLQHENICPVYLLGLDARFGYYVVMKFIDGLTLSLYRRKYLESHPVFPLNELARILGPVARALDYAHRQKIVHCDVKPQNIMIAHDDGAVELVDFGLASEIRSSVGRLSSTSVEYGGTYPYMSPEQWRGDVLDGRTDQYSLAVVAYEMLAGRRPFQSSDPEVLRMCALNDPPPPIEDGNHPANLTSRQNFDPSVNVALRRALAKSKRDRFETCTDFIEALCSCDVAADKVSLSKRPTRRSETPNFRATRTNEDQDDSAISRANRRAAVWVTLFGIAFLVASVGLVSWVTSHLFATKSPDIAAKTPITTTNDKSPARPAPAEAALRYRWQQQRAYLYSINLDIDQDQDRVLTLSGELAYTVLPAEPISVLPDRSTRGTGTAFVVHPDGYLLTCHHVTEGATSIEVALGGQTYAATLVVDDEEHDLALIRIEASQLPVLPLADSDAVEQGEEVRAIGFPLSSILGENIKATRGTIAGINQDVDRTVFQIDASINPGNSGGPLVNEQGEVVGVIFAKIVDHVAASVGFATPINDAKVLLSSQSVTFQKGTPHEKLAGPALVKQVAAATALVTVESQGGHQPSKGRVSLRCDGTLQPKSWRRSGQPSDSVEQLPYGRPISFSTSSASTEWDQVETDSCGRLHGIRGKGQLPNLLGPAARMILESLPVARQKSWSITHPIQLTYEQNSGESNDFPPGRRFGPRGFWNGDAEPTVKTYSGTVRIDYELGQRVGDLQTIQKVYEMKTDEMVGAAPRVHLKGQGHFVINVVTGIPQEFEMSLQLAENETSKSTKTPMKLTYKFVGERPVPAGQGSNIAPLPVSSPGQPVEANSPLEAGNKLVCEWSGKWQKVIVLKLNDDGGVRIHWEGWSDQWDEDVPRSRLRFLPK